MNRISTTWGKFSKSPVMLPFILMVALVLINWVLQPNLFHGPVFRINILTFSPLMLIAAGQAIIMISGNLDLSVGFGASLINCVLATFMTVDPVDPVRNGLVIIAGLLVAVAMGVANGFLVGYLKVPSFIGTFASSFVWLGLAIMVRPTPGGSIPRSMMTTLKAHIGPINVILAIIIVSLALWTLLCRYRLGRYIYAIGSSKQAAYRNGINVKGITLAAFAIGWVFVFLGTLVFTAQTRSGDARLGEPFALNSIAAAVIGGIAMSGGRGNPIGAAMGAVCLSIVMNIIYFAGIPTSWQVFVRGVIIILAIGSTVIYKRKYNQ
jgi:ribose transport system permease protein